MARLPRLGYGPAGWHLPLSDSGALELAQTLVLHTSAARLPRLRQLLAEDPPLALWTVCRAGDASGWRPYSLEDVAAWLADHLPRVLQWFPLDADGSGHIGRAVPVRWRELAADSTTTIAINAPDPGDYQMQLNTGAQATLDVRPIGGR